jgi:hypothetical protein
MDKDVLELHGDPTVGTVVKVWPLQQQYNFRVVTFVGITVDVIILHIQFPVYRVLILLHPHLHISL